MNVATTSFNDNLPYLDDWKKKKKKYGETVRRTKNVVWVIIVQKSGNSN